MNSEQEFKECFNRIRSRHTNTVKPVKTKSKKKVENKNTPKPILTLKFDPASIEMLHIRELVNSIQTIVKDDYIVFALPTYLDFECTDPELVVDLNKMTVGEFMDKYINNKEDK